MISYKVTFLFFTLSLFLGISKTDAQDAHYWTLQYGTRSTLLGGAVIGSVEDLGATYYNPARLSLIPDPSFLLSAKIYQSSKYSVDDGAGEGQKLTNSAFGSAPGLVAGSFKFKFLKNHHFAYSLLTRQQTNIGVTLQNGNTVDVITSVPGDELLASELAIQQKVKEEWQGLSWSYPISKKFSVGLTNYLVIRDQKSDMRVFLQALTQDTSAVILNRVNEYSYQHTSLLWKIGLAYDLDPLTIGMTATTPRVKLSGNGKRLYDSVLSGGDVDGEGGLEDSFAANLQRGIDAEYKSGWSVGLGLGYKFGPRSKIHASLEWFDKVNKFEVLSPDPFNRQDNGESVYFPVVQQLDQVINYGFGAEIAVNDKVSVYASYTTDFSAAIDSLSRLASFEGEASASISDWDINHIAGGASFKVLKGKADITLGATYSFATQDFPTLVNLPGGDGTDEPIFNSDKTTTLRFKRWRFIFGFSFEF
jgi:long-subunit fatty acid transport protein